MGKRPFLDYYTENEISPVSQDISDRGRHLRRRNALYRHVGLVPSMLRGRRIIEFGPGSGFNSVHTLSLAPERYVLVDGNPTGLGHAEDLLRGEERAKRAAGGPETELDFILSDFETFETPERYDLVLAEGFIPLQLDPGAMLRRLAAFAAPGGVVVCTCMDCASYIPDLVRRAAGQALVDSARPLREQAESLVPVFASHFASLPNMSRPVVDWILDNVLHPFFGKLMSISDAIDALDPDFTAYAASPHFLTDWRWYKDICDECDGSNMYAKTAWEENIHNLLDHSVIYPARDAGENLRLYAHAEEFVRCCFEFYERRDPALLSAMAREVDAVAASMDLAGSGADVTARKLRDGARALEAIVAGSKTPDFGGFYSLFGRCQQYLSFIRTR
jgi:trans-aconitate methyltransferase